MDLILKILLNYGSNKFKMTVFILKKIFGLLLIKATEYFTFLKP